MNDMQETSVKRRRGRFWLYGPALLMVLLAIGWSVGWFYLRDKAAGMIDAQLAREAAKGRQWSCRGRMIGGFPFRFEVSCSELSYRQGRISASLGPARIVVQAYNPRHVILEAAGPLQVTDGAASLTGTWKEMEASISGVRKDGFDRISLVTEGSSFTANGVPQVGTFAFSAQSTGLHIRPTPGVEVQDRSFDIAVDARGVSQPDLDFWTSDKEPLQVDAAFTVRQLPLPLGPDPAWALESWRQAGGVLQIVKLDTRKGARQFTLTGEIKIDDQHRPDGVFKATQTNFSELILRATSGGDVRAKLLQPLKPLPLAAKEAPMPLPPVRITNGEVRVAGFKTSARVQALY